MRAFAPLSTPAPTARASLARRLRFDLREDRMDLIYLGVTVGFFLSSWGFVRLVERV